MGLYNKESGYGKHTQAMPFLGGGQIFVVAKSAAAGRQILQDTFKQFNGKVRFASTIAGALTWCTASRGDVIYVAPGHTEALDTTSAAGLTIATAGVKIIGLGWGNLRPTLTGSGGTNDLININADNVWFENFIIGAPGTDNMTSCINVNGKDGVTIKDIKAVGSTTAKNYVDMITVVASSDQLTIQGLDFYNTTVAVNSFVSIEGACADVNLLDWHCFGTTATGGLIDGGAVTNLYMENVRIAVVGTTQPAATLDSNPTGMARNCFFSGTDTTLANNGALGNALRCDNIKVLEETDNSKSAAIIPAVDVD